MGENIWSYEAYNTMANIVYNIVIQDLKKGRGNKTIGGEPGGVMGNASRDQCVRDMRAVKDKEMKENSGICKPYADTTDCYLQETAKFALLYECGNCEEFSSLTFKYLMDFKVKPLDWMKMGGWLGTGYGNHAFVIIGRRCETDDKDISTWNKEVVWCDPYEKKIGGLKEIKERFGGEKIFSKYRWL
jgi:hypothetical protein